MPLEKIEILGFRGFRSKQVVEFAVPNGELGSGLTVVTGANNSGKSSIVECLKARDGHQPPSFSAGARNTSVDKVDIKYFINGKEETISSIKKGSSETKKDEVDANFQIFVLPSRRAFNPFFGRGSSTRENYIRQNGLPAQRSSVLSDFQSRLFNILENQDEFNEILYKVLLFKPDWSIDQSDQGQYFLKFFNGEDSHTSDGMGEGIVSIFAIVDSLYDSQPGGVIVIDEPELSLHPALQKRLFSLINEYSKDRQIIISTHSPYFVDINSIGNGAELVRVVNVGEGIEINQLSHEARKIITKLATNNLHNPHTFGLDAKELFFQDDGIVVVEGQEDVLLIPEAASQLGVDILASFFGWGAGGASNIDNICFLLNDLGFKKVAGILDGDQTAEIPKLSVKYPEFHFGCINADDIRTKDARKETPAVEGLLDSNCTIKKEHIEHTTSLFTALNTYMGAS